MKQNHKNCILHALIFVGLGFALGCGGSREISKQSAVSPPMSPVLVKTTPADGAVNVRTRSPISASFTQSMDASTLRPESFLVTDHSGNRVPGLVTLEDQNATATFTPANPLVSDQTYLLSLSGNIKDLQGRSIEPVRAGFKTAASSLPSAQTPSPIVIGAGYAIVDNTMPGGPVFAYDDISATGTNLPSIHGDDRTVNVPLPFPVSFYNVAYSSMYVGSNGYITFGSGDTEYSNYSFPDPDGYPRIAPFFDDLNINSSSMVLWQVKGTAPNRRLIVQWHDLRHFGGSGHIEFQVIMYENKSDILFQYQNSSNLSPGSNGSSATVGLNLGDGITASQYSYNTASLVNGRAILFTSALSFTDDIGRSRFCVYPQTASFIWTILSGPGTGSSYSGQAIVKDTTLGSYSVMQVTNVPGAPFKLNFSFNKNLNSASGYYVTSSVSSYLADSNTTNDPPGCF